MDNSQVASQPVNTGAAPEVSRPFAIPEGMTFAEADTRAKELVADKNFGARLLAGDKRAAAELDALQRHAMGQQRPEAKAEPTPSEKALAALGPPPKPEDYRLDNIRDPVTGFQVGLHGEQLPAETKALVDKTLFPAAHSLGLSQSDITAIAMTVTRPMTWEQCEAYLHGVWKGEEFEKGLADFRAAMNNPQHRELIEQYEQLSNSGPLIAGIVDAYRRQQARYRRGTNPAARLRAASQ
jgi:hypothetical protein